MKTVLGLLLGVLLLIAASGVLGTDHCDLDVYKDGCYYRGTCVRTWGSCPDYSICDGDIHLGTNDRCHPVTVGLGVFSDCPVDVSDYNQLQYGAKISVGHGINVVAVKVKIELEDYRHKKFYVYHWITPDCVDYSTVLSRYRCINLCKIQGLFLITVFDIVSYDECKEVVLIIEYIRYVNKPYYSVFDDCSDYQYEGRYNGPNSLYYWPDCRKEADVRSNCEGYDRVLVIPCNIWGGGFLGYGQDLSAFKYLTFYLRSSVKTKIEIGDGCHKSASYLDSTCDEWECKKICLSDFCEVDRTRVTWQFLITKIGCDDSEVKVANIRYTYC